jgi:putative hemolysin
MSDSWVYIQWSLVLVACAGVDAMFCGLETGIYRINRIRLNLRAAEGQRAARTLKRMGANFNNILAVLLIGTNLCRYVATFSISAMLLTAGMGSKTQWMTMAIATPTMFIVQDCLPKSLFQMLADRWVYRLVWVLRLASRVFNACGLAPAVRGFATLAVQLLGRGKGEAPALGHAGLSVLVREGQASGILTNFQSALADEAIGADTRDLRECTFPWDSTTYAPDDIEPALLAGALGDHSPFRLPLRNADGEVTGVLDVYNYLLASDRDPSLFIDEPLLLADTLSITDALVALQEAKVTLAVVVDATGHHIGIVTLQILMDAILRRAAGAAAD